MKKSLVSLFLLMVLLTTSILAAVPAQAVTTMYVYTENGLSLNVREKPSTSAKKIGSLKYGAQVGVDHWENNGFACIVFGSQDGYVMSQYLVASKPDPKKKSTSTGDSYASFKDASYDVVVNPSRPTGFVNLRWAPNTSAAVHATYFKGEVLRVIAESRNWLQVLDMDTMRCGFIMKKFTTPVAQ